MKTPPILVSLTTLLIMAGGCKSSTGQGAIYEPIVHPVVIGYGNTTTTDVKALPKARIYKTSGDYNNNVPVTLNAAGNKMISFPAPGDLTEATPLQLADGYLLDRRGISPATAFINYTYPEYSALTAAPSLSTLIDAIIPDATVTTIVELPMLQAEAIADTARVNILIKTGLPGCRVIYDTPRVPVQ